MNLLVLAKNSLCSDRAQAVICLGHHAVQIKLSRHLEQVTLMLSHRWFYKESSIWKWLFIFGFGRLSDYVCVSIIPHCHFLHRFGH